MQRHVERNREREALEAAALRVDLRVDAHHAAGRVEQRPAGVAGVHGHVGLNEGQQLVGLAVLGTDNACGHRAVEPKGRTNGDHPFTHPGARGVTYLEWHQARSLHLEHGHVGTAIRADEFGFEFAPIRKGDEDFIRAKHHVSVGQHQAVSADDKP